MIPHIRYYDAAAVIIERRYTRTYATILRYEGDAVTSLRLVAGRGGVAREDTPPAAATLR